MKTFNPNQIRQRRTQLGLSQLQLAAKAGTGRVHIVQIERGRKIPKATMLAKLAHALNVQVSYFFTEKQGGD